MLTPAEPLALDLAGTQIKEPAHWRPDSEEVLLVIVALCPDLRSGTRSAAEEIVIVELSLDEALYLD